MLKEPEPTTDREPELMPTTYPVTEHAISSIQETNPDLQSDQVCEPVYTSVPVGVLEELDVEDSGQPHPQASEVSLPQSGVIDFLMTSSAQALPLLVSPSFKPSSLHGSDQPQISFAADSPTQPPIPSYSK